CNSKNATRTSPRQGTPTASSWPSSTPRHDTDDTPDPVLAPHLPRTLTSSPSASELRKRGDWLTPQRATRGEGIGVPEHLDDGPRPDRVFFLCGQVPAFPGAGFLSPDPRAGISQDGACHRLPAGGELLAGRGGCCRGQARGRVGALLLGCGD